MSSRFFLECVFFDSHDTREIIWRGRPDPRARRWRGRHCTDLAGARSRRTSDVSDPFWSSFILSTGDLNMGRLGAPISIAVHVATRIVSICGRGAVAPCALTLGGGEKYRAVDVDDADDSGRQCRRITMEAAWGGWDGARESLESSSSFASFLLLGRWDARWDGRHYGMEFNLSSSSFRFGRARGYSVAVAVLLSSEKRI